MSEIAPDRLFSGSDDQSRTWKIDDLDVEKQMFGRTVVCVEVSDIDTAMRAWIPQATFYDVIHDSSEDYGLLEDAERRPQENSRKTVQQRDL